MVMNSDPSRPNWWGLKNFTISAKFHNPGIPGLLWIPGVRAVSQFLRCLNMGFPNSSNTQVQTFTCMKCSKPQRQRKINRCRFSCSDSLWSMFPLSTKYNSALNLNLRSSTVIPYNTVQCHAILCNTTKIPHTKHMCHTIPSGLGTEMQKVADAADIYVLFFSAGANYWAIFGLFLVIVGHFWANFWF